MKNNIPIFKFSVGSVYVPLIFFICALLSGTTSSAQNSNFAPPELDISRQRVPLLPFSTPQFDLRIQNPERSAVPRSVDEIEFEIKSIRVNGASNYSAVEVNDYFSGLIGRKIVLEELRKSAEQLERQYRSDGFFLARVFLPPQQLRDGILEIQVVEGFIGEIIVDAPDHPTQQRVQSILAPILLQKPVQLSELESRLLQINDLPGVTATSILQSGATMGSSNLLVKILFRPNIYSVSVANTASNILGPWTYTANASLNRALGLEESLDISLASAGGNFDELRSGSLRFSRPIGKNGAVLSIGGLLAFARPGENLRELDLRSRSISASVRFRAPLLRTRTHSLFFDAGLSVNRSRTSALGEKIVEDKTTVADLNVSWQHIGWLGGTTELTVSAFRGLGLLGASGSEAELPSVENFVPNFTRFGFSLVRNQLIDNVWSLQLRMQGQLSSDSLLSGELISFGGPALGRGYDPSVIAGERGLGGALEVRRNLPLAQPFLSDVQIYGFCDFATVASSGSVSQPAESARIVSLGAGTRYRLFHRALVDFQLAQGRYSLQEQIRPAIRVNINTTLIF